VEGPLLNKLATQQCNSAPGLGVAADIHTMAMRPIQGTSRLKAAEPCDKWKSRAFTQMPHVQQPQGLRL
jgi:hypothetical protein